MTTKTETKIEHWATALGRGLVQDAIGARHARSGDRLAAEELRQALREGIAAWWAAFVGEWRAALEGLRLAPGLSEVVLAERRPAVAEFHGPGGLLRAALDADGDLVVTELYAGAGGSRYVELLPGAAGRISPEPGALARDLITPWARRLASMAIRKEQA
jgi:glycerate kinase